MKLVLLKILKVSLVLSLLLLSVLLVFGLVLLANFPWWLGFFVWLGFVGLVLGVFVLKKYLKRRREQKFIHQIVAQDNEARSKLPSEEQDAARELQSRWKEAIETLRKSHLRKVGNPLYVLPWYMVIGESGSGKTTAIESARLSSPFSEATHTSGISGTRNCDWWFFEKSVIIDTAGRYAIPVDEGRDKDEWQKFLNLLSKYRKKEPLNGLVVTIAADRLAQNTDEFILENGRSIRLRIDELMRVLGAKFPVYIMVTKCDLIQGATEFCNSLPEDALSQAMGMMNHNSGTDLHTFIKKVFDNVSSRLRELRLLLLNKSNGHSKAASMLLFTAEFEKLQSPLTAFIQGAIEENPYQETPYLRGVYFSSGRQVGTPFSHFLKALNLIQAREVLSGTNKGLFLHDLFAKILPRDRRIFTPTRHMVQWRSLTRNMGLTAWVAVLAAVCGLMSFAFVKNLDVLSEVRSEFNKPSILQGDLKTDVRTLDRFRLALLEVEKNNSGWWVPRLGLIESLKIETSLKQKFVKLFDSGFQTNFDKAMDERLTRFNAQTPGVHIGAHVTHLARRINLLKARLTENDPSRLSVHPLVGYDSRLLDGVELIPQTQNNIGVQYLHAVAWEKNNKEIRNDIAQLQTWLKHLLTLPGGNLHWLADWVNADPSLSAVKMDAYWGGDTDSGLATVPAAFTTPGNTKIQATIAEIEKALFDPILLSDPKEHFNRWYENAYSEAWLDFVRAFDDGKKLLKTREQWIAVAKRLNTDNGPYHALINDVLSDFEAFGKAYTIPPWIALAKDWQLIRKQSKSPEIVDPAKSGVLRRATQRVTSKIRRAENAVGVKTARKPMTDKSQFIAAKLQLAYQTGLDKSVLATASKKVALQMASEIYSQDPATGESPLLSSQRALTEMKAAIGNANNEEETLFWNLLEGNIRLLHHYIIQETACLLQNQWEKDVLLEVQGVSADHNIRELMMGADGFATKFINGPAKPFITRSYNKGYHAKKTLGLEIHFKKDFFKYLTKGINSSKAKKDNYQVKISAKTTDTNPNAQVRPESTLLEMQCGDQHIKIENFNYSVPRTLSWSPQECGDVNFQISLGHLKLNKTYTGYYAFGEFLNDFKGGSKTFYPQHFPNEAVALKRLGIKYIKAKYQFKGHRAVLGMLYSALGKPPRKIISCWE